MRASEALEKVEIQIAPANLLKEIALLREAVALWDTTQEVMEEVRNVCGSDPIGGTTTTVPN